MSCLFAIACDHRVARARDVDILSPMDGDALIVGVEYHYQSLIGKCCASRERVLYLWGNDSIADLGREPFPLDSRSTCCVRDTAVGIRDHFIRGSQIFKACSLRVSWRDDIRSGVSRIQNA